MARPTKYDAAIADKIVGHLQTGAYIETAAAAAGIARSTLYEWLRWGAEGTEPYAGFSDAVDVAVAEAELNGLRLIQASAIGGEWTAQAWINERRFSQRWARKDPDADLKRELLQVELETAKAKLKLLEAGHDPDNKPTVVNVVMHSDLTEE